MSQSEAIGMYGETPRIKIGKLTICRQNDSDETVWIEDEEGIGGEFLSSDIEGLLQKYFDKNF
jgi:hypothetical protein